MSEGNNNQRIEEVKKELFEMQEQRKKIEDELYMHNIVLENNRVGMKDSLTDKDDFPRNDIDVFAVRQARAAIIKLENDARNLVDTMQTKLEELHSLSKPDKQT